MWSTHMLEHYSARKRRGILRTATTWVDPDIILLSDTHQPPTGLHLHEVPRIRKLTGTEGRREAVKGSRGRGARI